MATYIPGAAAPRGGRPRKAQEAGTPFAGWRGCSPPVGSTPGGVALLSAAGVPVVSPDGVTGAVVAAGAIGAVGTALPVAGVTVVSDTVGAALPAVGPTAVASGAVGAAAVASGCAD